MRTRPKMRAVLPWAILVIFIVLHVKFTVYDSLRLAWFAHSIAGSDRIIATNWVYSATLAFTGEEAKKIVRAISLAGSGRPRFGTDWANVYAVNARFYKGAEILGEIQMDGDGLFLIHYHKPPFRDGTGVLKSVICKPLLKMYEAEKLKNENQ